jgi:hypothetical protein
MHRTAEHSVLIALLLTISLLLMPAPARAVEDGLFDVRIGASYRQLLADFGTPHGILFPSGSGMIFQTTSPAAPGAGLPDFSQQTQAAEMPVYVLPIRASVLESNQVQWTYDFRKSRGIAIGIVLNGEGADAIVSDVIVAGFPKYLSGHAEPVRTAKGVVLQSTFEDVLRRYGYPPLIEIYPPSAPGGGARAGAGGAMRAGGMRGRGRGGRAEAPGLGTRLADSDGSSFEIVLTGARGMRGGGMRGGGMRGGRRGGGRGGGMRGGRAGRTTLPPLGTAGAGPGEQFTATAVVNHQAIPFSRSCLMMYEGIAFTLHDMRVYRIHVSE